MSKPKSRKNMKTAKDSVIDAIAEPVDSGNEGLDMTNDVQNPSLEDLKNIIARVQNATWIPSVRVCNIQSEESISVVDLNTNHSILVCAYEDSSKIFVKVRMEDKLFQTKDENLLMNYNSLKVAADEYKNRTDDFSAERYLTGHSLPVTGLKLIEDKDILLSSSFDGTVKAWNTKRFVYLKTYYGMDFISDIDVSSNSTLFAASSYKGAVSLFSLEAGVPEMILPGHSDDVNCVRFHPNGIYFATSSDDKTIKLWCTQTGNVARTFQDDQSPGTLAFSPDGKYLASYSGGEIKIWDLASGQLLTSFDDSPNLSSFCNLCFTEFGGVLASGGADKELKLWNVKNLLPASSTDLDEKAVSSENPLLQRHTLSNKVKLIKFDENNFYTCVTA